MTKFERILEEYSKNGDDKVQEILVEIREFIRTTQAKPYDYAYTALRFLGCSDDIICEVMKEEHEIENKKYAKCIVN